MPDADLILVAGATGNTGSGVAMSLLERGQGVRALVRDEAKAAGLREAGAEIAVVDLDRPETLTDDLLDGVTRACLVTWNGPTAYEQSRNLLDAIARSGAKPHVVRLSAHGAPQSRIIKDHMKVEEDLKASGLPWTMLRPTFFMQNVMMAAGTIQEQGAIYYDWGSGKAGLTDARDIVDCAVRVLTGEAGDVAGETVILTGPASIGFADVAATLTEVLGRQVEYVAVPHDAARESMLAMGFPEWIVDGYIELNHGFEEGFADTTTDGVRHLSGHEPRSFERFARDYAEAFGGVGAVKA